MSCDSPALNLLGLPFDTPTPTATLHASLPASQISTSRCQRRPLCLRCPNLHPRPAEGRRRSSSLLLLPSASDPTFNPPPPARPLVNSSRCEWPIFCTFCRWRRRLRLCGHFTIRCHHRLKRRLSEASLIRTSTVGPKPPARCSQVTFLCPLTSTHPDKSAAVRVPDDRFNN